MKKRPVRFTAGVLLVGLCAVFIWSGCNTLQQLAALRNVDFKIDRLNNAYLADVPVDNIRSYSDLRATDLLRLTSSLAGGRMPMRFNLHLGAENPAANDVDAQLVEMDWTLYLNDRETVSGVFQDRVLLKAGAVTDIAIPIELDLVQFFGNNVRDLVNIAANLAGMNADPTKVQLRATPVINTAIGPIRYPQPITIVTRNVQ